MYASVLHECEQGKGAQTFAGNVAFAFYSGFGGRAGGRGKICSSTDGLMLKDLRGTERWGEIQCVVLCAGMQGNREKRG